MVPIDTVRLCTEWRYHVIEGSDFATIVSVMIVYTVKTRRLYLSVFTKTIHVIFDYSTVTCDRHVADVHEDRVVEW